MANKEIKTLNLNGNTYEIVDEAARASLSSHTHSSLNSPDGSELLYCYSNNGDTKTLFQTKSNSGDYSYCGFGNNTFYTGEGYRVYAENYKPALTDLSGTLAVANGGTGANTAAQARHNIGADHAYNILVNSYFKDPVNSGGLTSYSGSTNTIDMWKTIKGSSDSEINLTISSNGITLSKNTNVSSFSQILPIDLSDKVATYAVKTSDGITFGSATISNTATYIKIGSHTGYLSVTSSNGQTTFSIYFNDTSSDSITIEWAALYEGSYTSDTLPAYIPYPKQVEMLRCGIATNPPNLLVNSNFADPVNSAEKRKYENGHEYTINKWMTEYNTCLSVEYGYINVYGNWHANQTLKKPSGRIYTLAARVCVNTVGDYTPNVSLGDFAVSMDAAVGEWKTYALQVDLWSVSGSEITVRLNCQGGSAQASISVEWVALYEGAYTADTLPVYVPYPKEVEILRCGVSMNPPNLLDNSYFSNLVAQAGVGGKHGSTTYAADRWLSTGTVSQKSGYIEITAAKKWTDLIKQYIDLSKISTGKTYTCAFRYKSDKPFLFSVISQTPNYTFPLYNVWDVPASSEWSVFVRTITIDEAALSGASSFYVSLYVNTDDPIVFDIEWAALYDGGYTDDMLPHYVPKGYAAELAECIRYFERIGSANSDTLGNAVYVGSGAKAFVFSIKYAPKRLKSPSVTFGSVGNYRVLFQDAVNASTYSASGVTSIDDICAENPYARFRVSIDSPLSQDSWVNLQRADNATDAYIDISADL